MTQKGPCLKSTSKLTMIFWVCRVNQCFKKTLQTRIRALGGSLTTIKDMYVSHGHIHFYYFNPVNVKDRQLRSFSKNLGSMLHSVQSSKQCKVVQLNGFLLTFLGLGNSLQHIFLKQKSWCATSLLFWVAWVMAGSPRLWKLRVWKKHSFKMKDALPCRHSFTPNTSMTIV